MNHLNNLEVSDLQGALSFNTRKHTQTYTQRREGYGDRNILIDVISFKTDELQIQN